MKTSPIEEKLAAQIAPMFATLGWNWQRQFRLGPYTADFAIEIPPDLFVIVEADGHAFHSRTDEQATHDRKRDRWFLRNGVSTIRFSSTEIFKNAEACATELIRTVTAIVRSRGHVIQRHGSLEPNEETRAFVARMAQGDE